MATCTWSVHTLELKCGVRVLLVLHCDLHHAVLFWNLASAVPCVCVCDHCCSVVLWWLLQVRGRLTVQEGRNVQYTGIMHATRTILREVRGRGAI